MILYYFTKLKRLFGSTEHSNSIVTETGQIRLVSNYLEQHNNCNDIIDFTTKYISNQTISKPIQMVNFFCTVYLFLYICYYKRLITSFLIKSRSSGKYFKAKLVIFDWFYTRLENFWIPEFKFQVIYRILNGNTWNLQ